MLGKVLNINPTSDYQGNSKRYDKKGDFKRVLSGYTNPTQDSSDISAASSFLKKTNWRIFKLNHSPELVLLEFGLEEFSFRIEIDLRKLASISNLTYRIRKEQSKSEAGQNFAIILSADVIEIPPMHYEPHFQFEALRILFGRIEKLDIKSSISKYDGALINSLLEGQLSNLETEFNFLNSAVLAFIKLITYQGIILEPKHEDNYCSITIEKISPVEGNN